jgi:hypothetical protein
MASQFDDGGIRFLYPENWRLEREESDDGWTVTVQSPETAFLLLTVNIEDRDPAEMLATALEALRADYPDLEFEDCVDTIAKQAAIGQNIHFVSLDLTNTCWMRSFVATAGTVMLLCQSNDLESEGNEQVLRAICASLEVDD